ncbi:MAG: ABC transporter permease [Rhizobiaceae bacterium]|nr:ABC transporter permease [Rhizobiaceae bacterium]
MTRALPRFLLTAAALAVPVVLIVLPFGSFLMSAFWTKEGSEIIREFSLANFRDFFANATYVRVFLRTLLLCAQVTLIGLVIGYPVAYFIWRRRGAVRYLLLLAFVVPLFMSYIVKIYTMRSILGLNGFLNQILVGVGLLDKPSLVFLYNQTSILVTMSVIFLPFVILPVFLSLDRIPRNLVEASADMGAGTFGTLRHVVVPLSLPGVVAGCLFTFVLALGDFVTPQMVGGPTGFTFGRVIWSQFGLAFNWPFGAAMGVVLLSVSILVILLAGVALRRQRV